MDPSNYFVRFDPGSAWIQPPIETLFPTDEDPVFGDAQASQEIFSFDEGSGGKNMKKRNKTRKDKRKKYKKTKKN